MKLAMGEPGETYDPETEAQPVSAAMFDVLLRDMITKIDAGTRLIYAL